MLAERVLTTEGPADRAAQRNRRSVTVNLAESPLTKLHARGHLSDRQFDAVIDQAGSGLSDVLWRVACAGEALADAEKALSWPTRSGKLVLKLALDRVAEFYRIG